MYGGIVTITKFICAKSVKVSSQRPIAHMIFSAHVRNAESIVCLTGLDLVSSEGHSIVVDTLVNYILSMLM